MSKFRVSDTFESPDQGLLTLAGTVVEGEVQPAMWINVPISEFMTLRAPILSIKTLHRSGERVTCLQVGSELGRILREDGVEIHGMTIDITETRIKPKGTLNLHDPYELRALTAQEFRCTGCGQVRQPVPRPDESYSEALERLAQDVKAAGWYVPDFAADGTIDVEICYCPACGQKKPRKAAQVPPHDPRQSRP